MHPLDGTDIRELDLKLQFSPNSSTAWKIIYEFFDYYVKDEANEALWSIVAAALISENSDSDNGVIRSDMVFFYAHAQAMLRAVYYLQDQRLKKEPNNTEKEE